MPRQIALAQPTFPGMCEVEAAVEAMSSSNEEERGAIFTKTEVVDFILDLVGYRSHKNLTKKRLLEPSFGHGSFLLPIVARLLASWRRFGTGEISEIENAILAVELHQDSFDDTRQRLLDVCKQADIRRKEAIKLADTWLRQSDFLLEKIDGGFDFVVGNPPYLRIERVPPSLMKAYRLRYRTMFDRADIYVPFTERSLDLLADDGKLGFICADRWTKNRYGGPLREKVAKDFHLEVFVDMTGTQAFESDVIAYPAITVIRRGSGTITHVAKDPAIDADALASLARRISKGTDQPTSSDITQVESLTNGQAPWVISMCPSSKLLRHIEERFTPIEDTGCKVGIGVATGADRVFIAPYTSLDVEDDRKIPLATTKDIAGGVVKWQGHGVINPFAESGKLVDLDRYPRLHAHLLKHKEQLLGRHVAIKAPRNWYRTIDRIHPQLTHTPKLLVPDIKGIANVVSEPGKLYPHHNLYYITAGDWDLNALRLVLSSGIAHLFVSSYSTKMRGGYLRFQAQHLRRICLPKWDMVPESLQSDLTKASTERHPGGFDLTCSLFDLSPKFISELRSHTIEVTQ